MHRHPLTRRDGNAAVDTRLLFALATAALNCFNTGPGTELASDRVGDVTDVSGVGGILGETEREWAGDRLRLAWILLFLVPSIAGLRRVKCNV